MRQLVGCLDRNMEGSTPFIGCNTRLQLINVLPKDSISHGTPRFFYLPRGIPNNQKCYLPCQAGLKACGTRVSDKQPRGRWQGVKRLMWGWYSARPDMQPGIFSLILSFLLIFARDLEEKASRSPVRALCTAYEKK